MTTDNNHPIVAFLDRFAVGVSVLFFSLFPLAYLTSTTEFTEYPKLLLILFTAVLLLAIWGVRALVSKRFSLVKTPFDLFFVFIIIAFVLATWQSVSVNNSLFGELNVWHWTLAEFVGLAVIFYVIVTVVRNVSTLHKLVVGFLTSSVVVAGISLVSYFNLLDGVVQRGALSALPAVQLWAVDGFSPAGNAFSVIYVLGVAFVFFLFMFRHFLKSRNDTSIANGKSYMALSLVGLLVTGFALTAWLGSYLPVVPSRVTMPANLGLNESWRIASSAIRDNALFGTGPSTYSSAYRAYRSSEINQTSNWNVVFQNSGSEYLTWMTTMGLVGTAALLLFIVRIVSVARKNMYHLTESRQQLPGATDSFLTALRLPVLVSVLGTLVWFLFVSSTVAMMGVFFMLLVVWMIVNKFDENTSFVEEINLNLQLVSERLLPTRGKASFSDDTATPQYLPLVFGALLLVIAGVGGYYTLRDVQSNLAFAQSIRHLGNNDTVREIYDAQRAAIQHNPRRDAYRRAYANTNISVAQLIATERGEGLTDTERQDVVTLVQQAIREVRVITELLNPTSALNWQIRGRIYQSLLGVARGADSWALHAFQQAIVLAPQDPQLRIDLGGLFLRLAIEAPIQDGTQGDAPGNDIPEAPEARMTNLLRAEAAFQDAIRLKPDFANGHFNLAILYQEAGRYDLAIRELETTLSLVATDSVDYQQASDVLNEVRRLSEQGNLPEPELTDPIVVDDEEEVQQRFVPTATPTPLATEDETSLN